MLVILEERLTWDTFKIKSHKMFDTCAMHQALLWILGQEASNLPGALGLVPEAFVWPSAWNDQAFGELVKSAVETQVLGAASDVCCNDFTLWALGFEDATQTTALNQGGAL